MTTVKELKQFLNKHPDDTTITYYVEKGGVFFNTDPVTPTYGEMRVDDTETVAFLTVNIPDSASEYIQNCY